MIRTAATASIAGNYSKETNAIRFDAVGSVMPDVEKYDIHLTGGVYNGR